VTQTEAPTLSDRLAGTLWGTAVGDALGLFVEGLPARKIRGNFGAVDRFLWPHGRGVLSDDTEQAALIAEALLKHPDDPDAFERCLRWLLVKWFWTFPPGIGKATAIACLAMTFGLRIGSRWSAGNGAAMRAAIIGTFFYDDSLTRKTYGVRAARTTHGNDDAIDGALYVAEVAACCAEADVEDRFDIVRHAVNAIPSETVHEFVQKAMDLVSSNAEADEAGVILGSSGYVLHTIGLATFCFLRYGNDPKRALTEIISCGGDTDSNAAVLGAWLGGLHGKSRPQELIRDIDQGPVDLDGLCRALSGSDTKFSGFNYFVGLARNVVLIPYVLYIAVMRLFYRDSG
jgi:ADP-ribosyl-[dinitrogen reductase] hydrolase